MNQSKQRNSFRSLAVLGVFGLTSPTSTPIPLKGLVVKLITEKVSPHKLTPCAPYARSKNWLLLVY